MGVLDEYFMITEDSPTPLCQQYDAFVDKIHLALEDPHPDIRHAIRNLKVKDREEFMPDWDKFKEDNGPRSEFMLQRMFSAALEFAFESYDEYKDGINKLYYIILEQLDKNITVKLELGGNWDAVRYDTIELLKALRDICYDINDYRVHPALDGIRKIQQFVGCKQKKGQDVYDYAAEVKSHYNVLKVSGGASSLRTPLIKDTMEKKFPEFKDKEYDSLSDEDKERVDYMTDQRVVSFVIVEGSKPSWKNDFIRHFAKVAGVRYNEYTRQYEDRK